RNKRKKMRRSFTLFQQNLRAFEERQIPCELFTHWYPRRGVDVEFDTWFDQIIKKQDLLDCVQNLHSRFAILPASVLTILGLTYEYLSHRNKMPKLERDARQRRADCKAIDEVLRVLEIYPVLDYAAGIAARDDLKTVKHAIEEIRPKKQPDIE